MKGDYSFDGVGGYLQRSSIKVESDGKNDK